MPVTDNNKDRERYKSISGDPNPPLDSRIDNFEDLLDAAQVDDDSLVGETRNIRGSGEETSTPDGQESTLGKNKAKNKGTASSIGAPPDVYLDAKDREKALKTPYTEEDLIQKIKEMPDQMLPRYIKSKAELIVKSFGINTREKVANLFGQLASESIRGLAEYVYYSKKGITNLGKKISNYREGDEEEFFYSDKNVDDGIPFGIKTPPWEKGGMFDTYYGGKYSPKNDAGVVEPDEKINDYTVDPGFYKGSPEGYAYRGHGAIQITGKYQYERMNQFFGVNGKYEKNNVDFLEYPELVSYNWRSDLGGGPNGKDQNKFALLSALMWWNDHKGVQINEVSLGTTTTITKAVSNSESTARNRHKNVERYYDFLLGGTVAKSLYSNVNYTPNNFKPGELKTRADVPQLSGRQKSSIFGHIEYEPLANGRVQILNNFEQENIVFVEIPQLKKFGHNGTRFHKKGAEQFKRLWAEWEELGLLGGILTFSPSAFSPRYSKAKGSRSLSSHSWGVAFDINQRWNDLYETPAALGTKGSVRELVPSAIKWGFFWGGWWTGTPDGMHFEISRVLDPNTLKFV
jgi:predicted chitinase